jgi:hypothetical protein
VPPVRDYPGAPAARQADLELEEWQLRRYRDRAAEAARLCLMVAAQPVSCPLMA